jgi:hypothetical protein
MIAPDAAKAVAVMERKHAFAQLNLPTGHRKANEHRVQSFE